MAVRTIAEVTVTDETDIDHLVTWYYRSTSPTRPSAPTDGTAPAAPWTATEPTYDATLGTTYLYTVTQTVWGDGSLTYGAVQLSSAYEAAKAAWNHSHSVETAMATEFEKTNEAIALSARRTESTMALVPLKHARGESWFWYSNLSDKWTLLDDGWAHYSYTSTSTGTDRHSTYIAPRNWPQVIPGEPYTFLVEVRNFSNESDDTRSICYMQQMGGAQFWGNTADKWNGRAEPSYGTYLYQDDLVDGAFAKRFVKRADTAYIGPNTEYDGMAFRIRIYLNPGVTTSFDMRVSVYPGDYAGPYNEYLSATSSAQLKVASDSIDAKVDADGVIAAINVSAEQEGGSAAKIHADKVQIDGTAIFSNGDFQSSLAQTQVVGENLLRRTSRFTGNMWAVSSASVPHVGILRMSPTASATAYAAYKVDYLDYADYGSGTYTLSFEARKAPVESAYDTSRLTAYLAFHPLSRIDNYISSSYDAIVPALVATDITDDWRRYTITAKAPTDFTSGQQSALAAGSELTVGFYGAKEYHPYEIRRVKIERGSVATPYSEAPDDLLLLYGGRNLLRGTGTEKSATVAAGGTSVYTGSYAQSAFLSSLDLVGDETVLTYSFDYEVTGTVSDGAYVYMQFRGSAPASGYSVVPAQEVDGAYNILYVKDAMSGHYRCSFVVKPDQVTSTSINVNRARLMNASEGATIRIWNVQLEQGLVETPWMPAPEDTDTAISAAQSAADSAVRRTQRIYYRSSSSSKPTAPTAWVTETGDKWAANNTTAANWTTKVTPISNGTGTNVTKYLYLWTCEQRELVDGTLEYTNILLDDSTTVIDGGKVITGSLSANSVDAASGTFAEANIPNLNASKITAGDISTDRIKANVIDAINSLTAGTIDAARINASQITIGQGQVTGLTGDLGDLQDSIDGIQVGGTNLLRHTTSPQFIGAYANTMVLDKTTGWYSYGSRGTYTRTDDGIKVTMKSSGNTSGFIIPFGAENAVVDGDVVTLSFDYRGSMTTTGRVYLMCRTSPNSYWNAISLDGSGEWTHFEHTFDTADLSSSIGARTTYALLVPYVNTASVWLEIRDKSMKLEHGNKATNWMPASVEMATNYISADSNGIKIANENPSTAMTYQHLTATGTDFVVNGAVRNRIDGDGMTLYDDNGTADGNVVAKFARGLIELGKGSLDAIVRFCAGKGSIAYDAATQFLKFTSLRLSNYARSDDGTTMAASQVAAWFTTGETDGIASGNTANVLNEAEAGYASTKISTTRHVANSDPQQAWVEVKATGTDSWVDLVANGVQVNGGTGIKAVYAGSDTFTLNNGQWMQLKSATQVAQLLGSGASQSNTICIAQNGDFNVYAGVVTGAMGQDGSARAYIYPNRTGSIRINYMLIRFA